MNVLMIGLGTEVLAGIGSDARARHLAYGREAGHLTMVVYGPRDGPGPHAKLSDELEVHSTCSASKAAFLTDAWRIARKAARERPPDVIVTQDPFATGFLGERLARKLGVPLVVGDHSAFFSSRHWVRQRPVRGRLFEAVGRRVLRRAQAVRVVNVAEVDACVRFGVPRERIHVLPTPVDPRPFAAEPDPARVDAVRARSGISGRPSAVWVGDPREPAKDTPTLLAAAKVAERDRPDLALVVVGDPTRAPAFRAAAEKAPNVILAGRVPHADLPLYYRAADVYLHSSVVEGLAKVMVEASAAARPVVTTAVPGIEAIVEDGITGRVVPIGDARALARAWIELADDPARARKMGEAAQVSVLRRFDARRMTLAIVDLWRLTAGCA